MVDASTLEKSGGTFSVSEFKEYLNDDHLSSKQNDWGWVFWRPDRADESSGSNNINNFGESIQEKIRLALDNITSERISWSPQFVAQFWAPKVTGGKCWLATLDPFAVGSIDKGSCWYRRRCMNHYYVTDNGAKGEQLGPPERAFRNRHPESTPDLRLYSVKEFPLRDEAAQSGFRLYLALPVIDSQNQCVGVCEVVSFEIEFCWADGFVTYFRRALEKAGLYLRHCEHPTKNLDDVYSDSDDVFNEKIPTNKLKEIREMLKLAIQVLPQLHLAQVWVPCDQCTNPNHPSRYMRRLDFISAEDEKVCRHTSLHGTTIMDEFLKACEFLNARAGKELAGIAFSSTNKFWFCRNISGLSIIDYSSAHYAQKTSLSFVFSICLQSMKNENHLYVFEFYLHSHIRDDAQTWSFLQLLLKIMEVKLKSFRVESGKQVGDELIVEVCKKNMLTSPGQELPNVPPVGYEIIQHGQAKKYLKEFTMVMPMESYHESYSLSEFKAVLNEVGLSWLEERNKPVNGWLFRSLKVASEAEVNDNSQLLPNPIPEKIITLVRAIASRWGRNPYRLVQFWAHKMIEGKSCLSTSDQPFALGILCEGLCSYRKQCMEHHYFVGEGAKEEELGPPGRVFRSCLLESSPDIRLYSIKELPLRDHAAPCRLRRYLALPVFDEEQMRCVGILEFLESGFYNNSGLIDIRSALEEANLTSTPFCFWSNNKAISYGENMNAEPQEQALSEIKEMLQLASQTPEYCLTQVWVPCFECAKTRDGWRCMKREQFEHRNFNLNWNLNEFLDSRNSHQVQFGKGVAGMALESENGSCFCRNLCDFSITEQPLAHYAQRARLDICFAICLQSSYTSKALYVLEFFLASGITRGGYSQSLSVLLQLMKQTLKSFKVASGQQLGDELVVDVIESGKEKKLSQSTYPNSFPIRFNIIQYSQEMETENSRNKRVHSDHNGMHDGMNISDAEQSDVAAANVNKEVITNKTKRSRKETSFHIDLADLEPHFGERLGDAARELGVGKSTLKRACRRYGIERWPGKEQNKRNPSLFLNENAANHFQDRNAETSISSGTNNPSLNLTAHQNKPHTNTESTQQLAKISCQETVMMMVNAKFNKDRMKFQIRISSGMEKLTEEVGKRLKKLKLDIVSVKLKYLDESDNEWTLLACEEDFQLCVKTLTALDKTCIQVLVELINN